MGRLFGIIIVGMLVLMFLFGTINMTGAFFVSIAEFLFNSIYGIIAIFFASLAILFFYGSVKTAKNSRIVHDIPFDGLNNKFKTSRSYSSKSTSKNISVPFNEFSKSQGKDYTFMNKGVIVVPENRELDLAEYKMNFFSDKLANLMTKPEAVFFKGWRNRRLQLDVEHIHIIKAYIDAMRDAGESFLNFRADQVLSYEKIQLLIQTKRNILLKGLIDSELQIDLLQEEHKARVAELRINIKDLEAEVFQKLANIEHLKANISKILSDVENTKKRAVSDIKIAEQESIANIQAREKELDIKVQESIANIEARAKELEIKEQEALANIEINKAKTDAEIFVMKLKATDQSKIAQQRSAVLDKIIIEMNLNNIRPLEVYLLIKLLDTINTDDFMDFDKKVELMEEELNRMKAENRYKTAEAIEKEAEAKERAAQSKANIKDINNPYA